MNTILLQSREDMEWFRDCHFPELPKKFRSLMLFGNEDHPEKIHCYERKRPLITDEATVYHYHAGQFRLVGIALCVFRYRQSPPR